MAPNLNVQRIDINYGITTAPIRIDVEPLSSGYWTIKIPYNELESPGSDQEIEIELEFYDNSESISAVQYVYYNSGKFHPADGSVYVPHDGWAYCDLIK